MSQKLARQGLLQRRYSLVARARSESHRSRIHAYRSLQCRVVRIRYCQFWIAPVWRAWTWDHVGERPIRIAWAGPSGKRIHITGAPRSGTTLLLSLMLACFAIDGGVARERRLWRTPPKNRRIVCTKFPDETDFAAAMLACDSDLHVIFIVRDPRDVVVSRHHASPGRYLTNLRVWRQNYTAARPYFDHPRFHVVRYRDLVRDPDAVQRRLGAAMPFLEPVRPFSRYLECSRDEGGAWLRGMDMDLLTGLRGQHRQLARASGAREGADHAVSWRHRRGIDGPGFEDMPIAAGLFRWRDPRFLAGRAVKHRTSANASRGRGATLWAPSSISHAAISASN